MENMIRKNEANLHGQGYANACAIWKGWGEMGQHPFGWWVRPFGQNAHFVGANKAEVREFYEERNESTGTL